MKVKRLVSATLLSLMALLGITAPAMAIDEPLTVSLNSIEIFTGLLTNGDILAVVPYTISYTVEPTENINETFIFRIIDTDNVTELGTALAYPYDNGGYGSGVVSFYFADNTTVTWGESYIFRVQQNPTLYPLAQYWDFTVSASAYSEAADQALALKAKIIDSATFLTTEYGVALLTQSEAGSTILSSTGELYYLNAIPGLQQMAPSLFSVQLEDPDWSKRTWSTTFADALLTKYAAYPLIADFMTGFAGLWGTGTSATMTTLSIFMMLGLIGLSVLKFNGTMLSATTDGYTLLLLLMLTGFFPMVAAGGIAFASVFVGGLILFFNRA